MNPQSFFPIFMMLILIGGLIILLTIYILAIQAADQSKSYQSELPKFVDEFGELKNQLQALKPICRTNPRQFLYSEIDNKINSSYRKAEQEMQAGLSLINSTVINVIDMPPGLLGFLRVQENYEKLKLGDQNKNIFNTLKRHLRDAGNEIANISEGISAEKKINTDIENELQKRLRQLTQWEIELSTIQAKLESQYYQRLQKSIVSIRNQLDSAQQTLQAADKDRSLNFARTFVFLTGMDQLIRLYDMDFRMAKVASQYEPDISRVQVAERTTALNEKLSKLSTLSYEELLWKNKELNNEDKNTKQVENVFEQFTNDCNTYQTKQKAVCELRLESDIQTAKKAEKDGVDYWGQPSESPNKWDPLLVGEELPSTRLQLIAERQKKYCSNQAETLKQSNLTKTIAALNSILTDVATLQKTAKEIRKAVDVEIRLTRKRIEEYSLQIEHLENDFLSLSPSFPTENRTWVEITKIFDDIQNVYRVVGESYKKMVAYESSAERTIMLLTTIKEEIETEKRKYDKECDDLTKAIQGDKKSSNDEAELIFRADWRIPLSLQFNSLKDLLGNYDVLSNKADRIRTKPIRDIPESLRKCREEKLELKVKILEKFGSINKLIRELEVALSNLENRLEREIRNGLSEEKQSQIRKLMEDAKQADSPDAALGILSNGPNRIL
jgi:hypothetical protein